MFKVGQNVSYSTTGICTVAEIKKMGAPGKEKEYYVLKPVFQNGATVYVPLDNKELVEKIRQATTKEEIDSAILKAGQNPLAWINDDIKRGEAFKEIIRSGEITDIIRLVSCIYLQNEELIKTKRKLRNSDAMVFDNAENYLYNEFSFVLGIKREDVVEYIRNKLS